MFSFILLSGGDGLRMGKKLPKQYLSMGGKPIIMSLLEKIDQIPEISQVVLVCSSEFQEKITLWCREYLIKVTILFAEKGETRQASVWNGLQVCQESQIILHEAARPFVSVEDFYLLMNHCAENVTYGISLPFTVLKRDEREITGLLQRNELVNIQLPQKFQKIH